MKKLFALMICLMLACVCSCTALAAPDMLTVDELIAFCDYLLDEALKEEPAAAEPYEEGGYVYDYGAFAIYTQESSLYSQLQGVAFSGLGELSDMRGVRMGDSLDALLAAYPLDNGQLSGTYDEATLYISGVLPGVVNTGRVVRTGSRVLVAEHDIYASEGERVEKCCVIYTLEDNAVVAVQILLDAQEMSLEEAQAEIDRVAALQEKDEYSAYRSETPEPLAREDLSFGEVDFLTATPDGMAALLGAAESDTWENDGDAYLRVMQWNGIQAVFAYDSARNLVGLDVLEVYSEELEGPRGLRVDDLMESVLGRFTREAETGVLYGDGVTAPYGRCDVYDGGAQAVYAAQTDEGTVLLTLGFVDGRLAEMTCARQ